MAEKKIRLKIITPDGIKLDEDTDMAIIRCITGDMGILPGRAACTAILASGEFGALRIIDGGAERDWKIHGGMAEVKDDVLTILTGGAELSEYTGPTAIEAVV